MALRGEIESQTLCEWATAFGDPKMNTALLNRLTPCCHTLETGNDSFRFKTSSAKAAKPTTEKARTRPPETIIQAGSVLGSDSILMKLGI
jgi:IstB-like ATP binding protein